VLIFANYYFYLKAITPINSTGYGPLVCRRAFSGPIHGHWSWHGQGLDSTAAGTTGYGSGRRPDMTKDDTRRESCDSSSQS